jgi:hypothetical protein
MILRVPVVLVVRQSGACVGHFAVTEVSAMLVFAGEGFSYVLVVAMVLLLVVLAVVVVLGVLVVTVEVA